MKLGMCDCLEESMGRSYGDRRNGSGVTWQHTLKIGEALVLDRRAADGRASRMADAPSFSPCFVAIRLPPA
jgi:hypothetical protein